MRITGGQLRSRRLLVPGGSIRPTQDRVREALFSSLGEKVVGSRFLDLYAGSGAVGIEAWSRGAASVRFIESSKGTFRVLRQNMNHLCAGEGGGEVDGVLADVERYLKRVVGRESYSLVFADPPYDPGGSGERLQKTLHLLGQRSILEPSGLFIYEQGLNEPALEVRDWQLLNVKPYGKTQLLYYQPDPSRITEMTT